MEPNWDDLRAVLAVVRGKSLAAASIELGVNYTTVARRITRAETATGQTLFERLADGYRPTEAGQLVADHAARMETTQDDMLRVLRGRDRTLAGDLTVTAPQLLIAHVLSPVLDSFARQHPRVGLRLRATNELLDLNRREADLAVRISKTPGDSLMGLRLAEQHNASFAAPVWAERIEQEPGRPIDWLIYDAQPTLPKVVMDTFPASRIHLRFDDMVAMAGAAQAGLGVVRMPMFLGRRMPGLVQVPVLPPQPYADIWIVAHRDVWPSAKLTAFRDHLLPFFRKNQSLFVA